MEVKVFVDGIQRVVCGVTEDTTCQDVVLALAQALGQPGRYTLREKFKDFERCMTPDEHLLETLERYGEQAKDVQLTLLHNGPSVRDQLSRAKVSQYEPCPPLRRKYAGGRTRRSSGSLSLQRQSLPSLSSLKQEEEPNQEELKRPKRKSLTLMEEAWEWLENLGKGKVYSTCSDKEQSKKTDKKNRFSLDVSIAVDKMSWVQRSRGKTRGQRGPQTSCCIGNQTKSKDGKPSEKSPEYEAEQLSNVLGGDERNHLRETIICQLKYLQDLQLQISHVDRQILELEENQKAQCAEQEAQERLAEEEREQMQFWENELRVEESIEKDLQCQFFQIKARTVECKVTLNEYKHRLEGLGICSSSSDVEKDLHLISKDGKKDSDESSAVRSEHENQHRSDPDENVNVNRKFLPKEDLSPPHAPVPFNQIRERRPTGPTELREWWTRWSEAQSSPSHTKKKVIHRSELTIYLSSTKL